jgi:hypothetical protein
VHTSSPRAAVRLLLSTLALSVCVAATVIGSPQKKKDTGPKYREYRVAAGTYLPIELRTRLSSNTNKLDDGVDGRLTRAVTAPDGMELIPEGSVVLGTVSEVEPAGKKKPGHLEFTFHIIEHPETGSRATIRTTSVFFVSERPAKGDVFQEIRLEKGLDATVSLLAPLTVRIPVKPAVKRPRTF